MYKKSQSRYRARSYHEAKLCVLSFFGLVVRRGPTDVSLFPKRLKIWAGAKSVYRATSYHEQTLESLCHIMFFDVVLNPFQFSPRKRR